MRVLIAPDEYGGNLSAQQVAEAIAEGWQLAAPQDELRLVPMSDGGPGFLTCLSAVLPGELISVTVDGPLGAPTPGAILRVGDTAYIESATAIGLSLLPDAAKNPTQTSSRGLGQLIMAALDLDVARIIVGLGGSSTNDAGAGLLAALGISGATDSGVLSGGGGALDDLTAADLSGFSDVIAQLAGTELIGAVDVDVPLLGFTGASAGFAEQKGASTAQAQALEGNLAHFARQLTDAVVAEGGNASLRQRNLLDGGFDQSRDAFKHFTRLPGAGAAGGIGFALAALGGTLKSGADVIAEAVELPRLIAEADIVVTGEGSLDWQSLHGKVIGTIAALCEPDLVPCVVIAGQNHLSRREWSSSGISGVYPLAENPGEVHDTLRTPQEFLRRKSQQVGQTWSR